MKKKKKKKRGRKKARQMSLLYNNINGLRSKLDSLHQILDQLQPEIVCLCETKVGTSKTIDKYANTIGYKGISRCSKDGQGGLVIAGKINSVGAILDVTSSPLNSILVGRIAVRGGHIRIILGYAPQETEKLEIREEFFTDIGIEIQRGMDNNDAVIVVGDLNAKIEGDKKSVIPMSNNGKLLYELIQDYHLEVTNLSDRCVGKWTHVIRTSGETSRLDYVMADKEGANKIMSMMIDEPTLFTPFRIKNKKMVLSDHNSILVNIKATQSPKEKQGKHGDDLNPRWRLSEEGIEKLPKICEANFSEIDLYDGSTQDAYNRFHQGMRETMNECFKQVKSRKMVEENPAKKIGNTYANIYKNILQFSKKGKAQRSVAKTYQHMLLEMSMEETRQKSAARIGKAISAMTIDGEFDVNKFWKLRKGHRPQQTPTSVVRNGVEVCSPDQIRRVLKEEFEERLQKPQPRNDVMADAAAKANFSVEILTDGIYEMSEPYKMEELDEVLDDMKRGKSCGPDGYPPELFIEGGQSFKISLLNIVNRIKGSVCIP